ncbi:MAG: bifunctional phosphopantothenoylcysteine decarboxylase/phosphopantothenate--cysteine ligase CoaBC [Deltaproteobacteria bacterium]|nr:bifunctional phosphopantothenoylcysteine decarboxylase/phosphopantothenate--cysteine ligase CoaBC [Deltaproteobacteria bacterium]MBW2118945.1 bifunctional phosphopantothenoylcysteine decarboxylase/phosphopantothenate--cysteine ligase CoaBC [Deltaproteobacteria bacterium]MBW2345886.1 bifunctional phosphopantothenoylcysteine decarboxylase/phosphopantothenate--cysteine ligase CoaBC [Deltaproteobacteria bacterium]
MKDKKIIVGITGGIAAYKAAELVRLLMKANAQVRVAMTGNAVRFITPLTLEALSGNRVIWDMWGQVETTIDHITYGQESDLIIIAPATANIIAKMAHGIADDFISTMVVAATAKILVCPSMNDQMLMNPAVQNNLRILNDRNFEVMETGEGQLACHSEGPGRLPEPQEIAEHAWTLLSPQDLSGQKVLVTAGPTVEPIDPVRYISNRSSGRMGFALAKAARRRGASVTLVSGPVSLMPPYGVTFIPVKTAEEMRNTVLENRPGCDIIIKAAAVSDYRPKESAQQKIKKGPDSLSLDLVKNPDILSELGDTKKKFPCVLVGFAAETEDLLANAEAKLKAKNLDMIVANDVSRDDAGFETDTNIVKMIFADGHVEDSPLMTKDEVADLVLDRIKSLKDGNGN